MSNSNVFKSVRVEAKTTRQNLVRSILRERFYVVIGLILVLLASLATVSGPRLLAQAVDDGLQKKDSQVFFYFAILYFTVEAFRPLATMAHTYFFSLAGQKIMQDLRIRLYQHFLKLPAVYFDKNPSGQIVTRITNDIAVVGQLFTAGVVNIVEKIFTVVFIITALFLLNVKLALIALAPFPILFIVGAISSNWLHGLYRRLYATLEKFNTFLSETILGVKVIQLYAAEETHMQEFDSLNSNLRNDQFKSRIIFAILHPLITMITGVSVASLIWFGGHLVINKEIQVGILLASITYILWLFWPVIHIIEKWNLFLSGISSAERVFEALTWQEEDGLTEITKSPARQNKLQGHIVFENVSFAYTQDNWVLKNFSFEFPAGKQVGIIGPSGSGKSTIANLLRRLYEPQQGRILIDGVDIREMDKRSLRAAIGFVQQDLFLFSGSIEKNISLDEEEDSLKTRKPYADFLTRSSFQKIMYERGANISAGEMQLLSFLRCFHSSPDIWILDEASANLDQNSERQIFELLKEYAPNRSIISIAHRVSSLRNADLIVVLHQGKILENGSHQELINRKGFYAKLYNLSQ